MARKGRARRFREARELKQGYDDGLFAEGSGTLADVADADDDDTATDTADEDEDDDDDDDEDDNADDEDDSEGASDHLSWDPDRTD